MGTYGLGTEGQNLKGRSHKRPKNWKGRKIRSNNKKKLKAEFSWKLERPNELKVGFLYLFCPLIAQLLSKLENIGESEPERAQGKR